MGSIDIIKHLSTLLSCAVNKSQQHQEKNSWECWGSNPGLLGEKQEFYLFAKQPHKLNRILALTWSFSFFGFQSQSAFDLFPRLDENQDPICGGCY